MCVSVCVCVCVYVRMREPKRGDVPVSENQRISNCQNRDLCQEKVSC